MVFILAVLVGALNDRLLLVNPTDSNPKQKKAVEIKSCLVGLLEPLLIGFATMQQYFEQKLDLSEILYQITSRYICCLLSDILPISRSCSNFYVFCSLIITFVMLTCMLSSVGYD